MSEEPEKLAEGTLISHLLELRDRLLRALVAVGLALAPCVYYSNDLFSFLAQPLIAKLPQGSNLIATGVMSPFTTPFKLSFFAALMIAMPYIIYQLWAFVAPGLYRNERRFAVPLLVSSIVLFYVGIAFAYYFVFPVMFEFFTHTTPKGVSMMTDITSYLDFALTMFFWRSDVAFEVPIAVVLLVLTGIVQYRQAAEANRGYVLIGDLHYRRHPHAAGCTLPMCHGGADVHALRGRSFDGADHAAHAAHRRRARRRQGLKHRGRARPNSRDKRAL
jgi:sec-independent protein translocase protein TatC